MRKYENSFSRRLKHHVSIGTGVDIGLTEHSMKSMSSNLKSTTGAIATFIKAATFVAEKHRNQRRKDADESPYINHLVALVNVLANEGGIEDPIFLFVALLHDTIEDTETTVADRGLTSVQGDFNRP